ncbi:MAG: hypothetical protein IJ413_07375 [Bacteroides sp.]|nr:hypothetical protein [Bacteroides sp.]
MKNRYKSIDVKAPLEFGYIFRDLCRVGYKKVLRQYSREMIIRLAVLFNREYCNKPAAEICHMLSSKDPKQAKLSKRIDRFLKLDAKPNIEYIVGLEITSLELLRRAFSIPYKSFNNANIRINIDKLQFQTVKLITQINEESMKYKIDKKHEDDLGVLLYTNNASSFDILHYDKQNEYIAQVVQATMFFKLLENNLKYDILLKEFYNKYKISNWREYLRTLISLFCITYKGETSIIGDLSIDVDSLMTKSVLEKLSIPISQSAIPYSSKDEFDLSGNSDYKFFRDKPLFKSVNGDYIVHSQPLLTDRIYSSLYFDFKNISKQLNENHPDIGNLFTSEFVEKTLFVSQMKSCTSLDIIDSLDENELKKRYKIKNGELGYPDYYIKTRDSVILFECKDIRINAWIKEQRDFTIIEEELRNKLVCKTYQIDYKNHCHKPIAPKRIGCGQLAGHVANIRNGVFPWDSPLSREVKIYSVLVIADNRLLVDGLTSILQRWYLECLCKEGLNIIKENPLILMSPLTLIKYSKRFSKDGFLKYFNDYYNSIYIPSMDTLSAINKQISFDDYMSQYPFKLDQLGEQFIKELMADRVDV